MLFSLFGTLIQIENKSIELKEHYKRSRQPMGEDGGEKKIFNAHKTLGSNKNIENR